MPHTFISNNKKYARNRLRVSSARLYGGGSAYTTLTYIISYTTEHTASADDCVFLYAIVAESIFPMQADKNTSNVNDNAILIKWTRDMFTSSYICDVVLCKTWQWN